MDTIRAHTFLPGERNSVARLLKILGRTDNPPDRPALLWGNEKVELPEEVIPVLSFAARAMSRGLHVSLITKPELLTTQEAAEMIACSRQHIVDLINEGKLKATSIGTHRRIKLDDVLNFIEQEDKKRDTPMASFIDYTMS